MEVQSVWSLFFCLVECVAPTVEASNNLPPFPLIEKSIAVALKDYKTIQNAMRALTHEQKEWNADLLQESASIYNEWLAVQYVVRYDYVVRQRWGVLEWHVVYIANNGEQGVFGYMPVDRLVQVYHRRNQFLRVPFSMR